VGGVSSALQHAISLTSGWSVVRSGHQHTISRLADWCLALIGSDIPLWCLFSCRRAAARRGLFFSAWGWGPTIPLPGRGAGLRQQTFGDGPKASGLWMGPPVPPHLQLLLHSGLGMGPPVPPHFRRSLDLALRRTFSFQPPRLFGRVGCFLSSPPPRLRSWRLFFSVVGWRRLAQLAASRVAALFCLFLLP